MAGIEAMGLQMHVADPTNRLWTLNTPRVPEGVDDGKVRKYLLEERGMEIAGGFGPLAGKAFRIGLMGYGSQPENMALLLEALEAALKQGNDGFKTGPANEHGSKPEAHWRVLHYGSNRRASSKGTGGI